MLVFSIIHLDALLTGLHAILTTVQRRPVHRQRSKSYWQLRDTIDRQIPYVITCTEQACASTQHIHTNAVLTGMQAARRSIVAAHNKADLVSQDARHRRVRMKPMELHTHTCSKQGASGCTRRQPFVPNSAEHSSLSADIIRVHANKQHPFIHSAAYIP